jgi:HlyD family secretion protein
MKPQRRIILILAGLALLFLVWRVVVPMFRPTPTLSGYVEGETLYLASPVAGTVAQLGVRRGQRVAAGTRLFVIEPGQRAAQGEQASAELDAARLPGRGRAQGQRPGRARHPPDPERDAAAAAAREGSNSAQPHRGAGAARHLRPRPAGRGARPMRPPRPAWPPRPGGSRPPPWASEDEIRAADARLPGRRGWPRPASVSTTRRRRASSARVEEVFYQRGEWAAANQPIVALIPDDRVYVRFFVPEQAVAAYRPGVRVRFRCDGCPDNLGATISYVSPRPEFTPPIIYSREARDRLVFMVEARPENGASLVPGLPVDVYPVGGLP